MVNAQEENTAMTAESIFQEIKEALSGRPGQAIVLGVCQALATRFRQEVWLVRLVTIVFAIVWTFPIMAIYILLGFFLPETEDRSRHCARPTLHAVSPFADHLRRLSSKVSGI